MSLASWLSPCAAEVHADAGKRISINSAKVSLHTSSPFHPSSGAREWAWEEHRLVLPLRGTVFLPTSPAASVRKCLRTCHTRGAVLEGLEVCLVTALLLPIVNMTGKSKPFLDFYRCSWFTVLLPYRQKQVSAALPATLYPGQNLARACPVPLTVPPTRVL